MSVHSFFEGIALGVSTEPRDVWNLILAISSHKWSEALTVGISFVSADVDYKDSKFYMIFYSFVTPLGILVGYFISSL